MNNSVNIKNNLKYINDRISTASELSGRKYKDITLVAVTKSFPKEIWEIAMQNNLFTIAENRIKETEEKYINFYQRQKLELHLIGHLQTKKARKAVKLFDVIETVDSLKLADKLNIAAEQEEKIQKIYIQVNTGEDPKKSGFLLDNILENITFISKMNNLKLQGIMTIPPQFISELQLRKIFKKTRDIRNSVYKNIDNLCKNLSMGMSNDFEIAIQEGATHIRLGTAVFGKRP